MNTQQLWFALSTNSQTKKFFDGVYAYDTGRDMVNEPSLIIVNTDPSNKPGQHWLLLFFHGGKCQFFDSLGHEIEHYPKLLKFVHIFTDRILYSGKRIQPNNTSVCGQYCLFYAYYCCKGFPMMNILDKFYECTAKEILTFVNKKYVICEHGKGCCSPLLQSCSFC